ncbi:MAG: hypothetical protein VW907_02415 [Opitutae bacterium]
MSQKFLTSIDLNQNELQNAVIQNLSSAPSHADGRIYYDTTLDALYVSVNGSWVNLQDTGAGTLDIAADSGTDDGVVVGQDTLTISGTTNQIATSVSGDTISVNLTNTGVTATSYGSASEVATFTVDAQGRLTAASSTTISITSSQLTDFTESTQDVVGAQIATNGAHTGISASYDDANDGAIDLSLTTTTVTAGSYGSASAVATFTVDAYGRLTAAGSTTISITSSQVSDLSTNAVTSLTGTANEVEVSGSTGAVTVGLPNDVTIGNDLTVTTDLDVGGNAVITGNLTVNGTTTTISTTNTVVEDTLLELGNGTTTAANDSGIVIERGATGDNVFIGWDESADKFIMGTTTATGASTGDLSITAGTLVANLEGNVTGDVAGNADTATEATNITAVANNSNNETVYLTFVDGATGTQGIETDTGLTYNPSTGVLTTTSVSGNLTGNVTGNLTGTVLTASQTNITAIGTITTGEWQATDIGVAHGGTGASTAAGARDNLAVGASDITGTTLARIVAVDCAAHTSNVSQTTVTHNFGTKDVIVQVYEDSTGATVTGDVVRTSADALTVTLNGTISAGDYRIVVTAAGDAT